MALLQVFVGHDNISTSGFRQAPLRAVMNGIVVLHDEHFSRRTLPRDEGQSVAMIASIRRLPGQSYAIVQFVLRSNGFAPVVRGGFDGIADELLFFFVQST